MKRQGAKYLKNKNNKNGYGFKSMCFYFFIYFIII